MPSCIVKGCRWRKNNDVTLHVFPKNIEIIKSWLSHIPQDFGDLDDFAQKVLEGKKSDSYRICSMHFSLHCYSGWRRCLRKDAVPTIFVGAPSAALRPQKRVCTENKGESSEKREKISTGMNTDYFMNKTDNWTMTDRSISRRSVETQVVKGTSRGVQCDLDREPEPLIGLSYMDSLGFIFGTMEQ